MDEQVLQDLYARAQSLGYKKGIEDFRTLIQTDPSVQDDNFAYVQSRGYKKTKEDFLALLGMNQSTSTIPLKKKESAQSTESLSGDGSLGQSLPEITKKTLSKVGIEPQPQSKPKEDPLRFNQMPPQMQVEAAFKIIQGKGYQGTKEDFIAEYGIQVPQTQEEEYRNKDIFAQNIRNAYSSALRYSPQKKEVVAPAKVEPTLMEQTKEQFAEQFPKTIERIKKAPEEAEQIGEYLETVKKGEREAELAQIQTNQQDEEFLRLVSGVDNLYIKGASEERAERELNERFKKYGIVFAQSKAGRDVLIARTADGKKSIEVPLAASTSDYNSKRLRDFIIQNGKAQTESMSEDFITKSLRAQNMRRVGRLNKDGSASTVEFMSFEQDGKFLVAPTLFPKDNLNYGADPRGWMKLEPAKAIEEARKRGEIFEFKTKAEAERFAEGAWKDVTMSDLEGQKFFQERGLDYFDYKDRRDEMLSIDKEQALIENVSGAIKRGEITNAKQYFAKKLSPEEAIKYSYLLNGNNLRPDLESYVQKRQQQKNELYTQVEDRTFFNDGKVQTTFEDFDVYLNKKSEESKKKAEEANKIAKEKYEELNAVSMEAFGVPAAQLMTYKPKTQDEVNVINDIKQRMSALVDLKKVAAERYYASSTFFDSKLNKAARNEYDENMAAWWSEFNSAWARGEAGAQLMKTIMGVNSVEEAGQLISEAMQDAEGGTRSRAFQTFMSAGALSEDDERAARAFWSDPFEILTNLVATSFAQLLPIGFRIVPATTLAGAGIGAGVSAASTGGLGTIGGAVSGGKYGFQTGMEMANFAMEYTNSFFEAAQERGYDVKDPEQFVKAYADDAVWNETNNIGIRRGLAIGGVGLISSSLAGKVFKVSKLASKAQKVGSFVAERAVFDPLMEGAGELLAQEWSTGTYDLKEIEGEMMGGIGNNAISAGFNIATSALKNTNIDYANTLTDISAVAEESASDERISNWAANMRRLGQIDAETEQRIQRNVGLRRESKDLLSVGDNGKIASKDSKLQARMMELMAARDEMSSTNNRREVYRNYIAQVNEELREIAETKKLRAPENAVNLSTMNAPTSAPGIPKYSINGRSMTKANFMDAVGKMSKSRYMRSRIVVDNDEATTGELNQKLIDKGFITKPKTDAIQEQSTAQVSPQVSATVGEGVGEQVPGQEEVAGEVEQERLLEETQQQVEQSRGRLSELEAAIPAAMEVTPEVLVQATNNELAPEQLDGVLSSIADDIISETELSPEQDALVSANKARVDELVSLKSEQEALSSEVSDLETMLSQSGGFQFRAGDEKTESGVKPAPKKEGEITLYHSTPSDFTEFRVIGQNDGKTESQYTELGIHLGTEEQAKKRAETKRIPKEKQRTIKVKINPKKVIRVTDKGRWTLSTYKNILFELGLIQDKKEIKSFEDVLAVLKDNNIDAFVYDNKYEGKGDSYIVFDNKNIEIEQSTGENPLQDVESTTKAFEGVDEKSIGELPFLFNHSTQMFDNDGNKIEFKDFEEGHRIFRVGETKVQPIWFSKKPYAEGNEIRQIKTIINTSNPFDFRNKTQRNNLESFAVSKYGEKYKGISELIENGDWESLELDYDGAIPALIKEAGHDSYFSKEGGQVTIAVFNPKQIKIATPQSISQAYHKAKADGNNPELVKAVESLLGTPKAGPQFRAGEAQGISIVNGWYSTIEKNLRETKIEKQSANKWLSGGFIGKGDEAIYTGVKGWLESKNPQEQVSKQEILDWMKDNRVEIVEVVKGGDKSKKDLLEELGFTFSRTEDNRYKINIPEGADSSDYGFPSIVGNSYEQVAEMAVDLADIDLSGKQDAKYTQYQLEGEKENYKEVLVTLPSKGSLNDLRNFFNSKDRKGKDFDTLTRDEFLDLQKEYRKSKEFKSTHFDEPNILVHLRMNTRTDADGNKVLFLEEIQSDWGQKGKKEGFKISDAEQKARNYYPTGGVPQAPFVTDTNAWTKLGLKIALREAVAQGATKIAWTTGEQQNERFDLSEQLDSVEVSKDETGMYKILGKKDGETVASRFAETPQEMESFIGKELTDKIISSNIPSGGTKIFSGVDLKVGGKGMKGFYDKIVPDVAKALVKELTGKKVEVGETRINQLSDGTTTQQSIDITPELKAQVQRGMPLFRIDTKRGKKIGKFDALEGAPKTKGLVGPDPNLVAVAEEYAKKNGIPFVRQGEYVQANEKRGKRIALAFDRMKHDPSNPKVKEAYADLIRQTRMQYEALVDAGYEFTFFDSNSDPYQGNPSNAMRDLRENKKMAVYGTYDGYGTDGITATAQADNPMLEYTGLKWKDQNGVEHPVTANDLFRAVHDAFGHGLEGAGFRARGEENAWQAHVRLFTGPAVGAITSETRGQNSWLNFGPYGEQNKKASVFDTVFSEQKIGLMPEWTWTEGRAMDMPSEETSATEEVQEIDEDAEVERIVSEMNELESPLVDTSAQIESTEGASTDVQELNSRLDTPLDVVNIQILDGVPVLVTISDQLVASNDGVTDNVTGTKITNLFGGLGFNGIKKFLKAAWANVNEDEAKNQHKKAVEIYENNKAIIEKFWADNPKYDGHVPMLVVKMGENSILSNEAVSRVLIERIKSLNLSEDTKKEAFSNLQKRLDKFVENYKKEKAAVDRKNAKLKEGEKKKAISASTKNPYSLAKFISENNIKDFDGVLNSIAQIPISARGVINKLLTSGSVRKPGEKPKKTGGAGKDSIAKILLGDNKNNSLLSIQSITDVLTEPSTSNVPIGSVISVVGVKVAEKQADGTYKAAGRAIKVGHPNYEYGAEGMSFGVVKNPMTLQSIMPAAYDAVVSKNIEKVKEKKKPIGTSTAMGIGQGLKGLVGRTISTNPPKMMALISLINKAFPNVAVYTTTEAFNRILQNTDTKLTMKGDAVLYGVTANGDIYINPEVHNTESELFNTIIHEFGHVWLNMLLTSPEGSKERKLYQQGINIIREGIKTDPKLKALYDSQMKLFNNNEADAINEMLAILIGNRGEMISKASIRTKFNDFLLAMWEYVRATFKMSKDISVEEISNMSLDDFLGTAMADLLSGEDMKISDAQLTKMRNLTSMARQDDSMQSIIDLGRQNGFSDQSIKEILMRRGFKAADIDTAMEVRVDLMTELPDAFANVEGGVKEGMKLFADVRQQLSKYAKKKVKEADGTTRTRTMSEMRQKALELLKEHPIFKAQANITKDELILAFDRSMSTRANRGVDAQIAEIRKGLKAKKMGIKELAAAQKKLINFVSSVLPQSKGYSAARIERIVRLIGSTNINNFDAQAERVMKIIEAQKDLMAKKDIADAVARQRQEMRDRRAGQKELRYFQITLKNFIRTNLPKSKGYSQLMVNRLVAAVANTTTQNYVAQAVKVLNVVEKQRKLMSNQRIKEIANLIVKSSKIAKTGSNKRRAGRVDADTQALFATMKQTMRALAMAQKGDSSMLDRISASVDPAILAGKGIDLDEVQQKIDNGEELTAAERDAFNTTVALQELGGIFSMSLEELDSLLERTKEMATEGIARLKADKLVLSAEISSLKQQAEAQIKSDFGFLYDENGDLKSKNRLDSEFRQIWENFRKLKVWEGIKGWVKTIDFQSLTGFQDFMRKKIYHLGTLMNVLDKGGDFFKKNVYDVLNRMDEKSKRGFQMEMANLDSFARSFGFKNYKQFARSLNGPPVDVNGKLLTIDQMLRVYALSKNPIQRNKLIDMGIDIDRVESLLTDEQKGFADMVVDYLSNSYFDGVNSIYSYVNNVNLGYVENYFPTKTIQTKIDGNILESGDFGSVFNAETAPALKERTDTKGEIDLSSDFTAVLENHFRSMERYKAMAIGVRKMVQIFKMEDVKTLLERTGTKEMIMRGLNFAINPDSMTREPTTVVGKLSSKFTGFALSFKAIQILKQGSSFVQAFEDYTVRKGKPTPVLDHIMFMLDMAYIVATLPKQIKKAYDMSANVKDRLDQGLEGDVYGLESGTGMFRPISKSSSAWAKARRAFQTGAAAPTVLGDIIGVLGYMAVYNRMIKQGFTHAEALDAFNNYNSTQQSRRATEKSPIQMSNNEFQRLFTMFGSTVFLQMNKIAQTSTNIMRSAKKGKMPKAKDVRGLMLNLAISNVLFVGAANIAKFIKGDDEDKEEALKAMRNAMLGLNVIYAIPIFGSALESMVAYAEGEPDRADDTINVFQNLFRKYKKAEEGLEDGNVWAAAQPLVEIVIGAQLDPFIGIYNYFGGDEDMQEDAAYDMLGITPSYRPSNDEKPVSTMGKEDMKRYFPDLYDEVYGPNSPGYDIQQEINEMEKEIEKEQQQLKDEAYGYSE